MKSKHLTGDLLLIFTILLAALLIFTCTHIFRGDGTSVEVKINGELYAELPLNRDDILDIDGLCTLKIENGEASITEAVCRNQLCVRHAPVSRAGESIVCLPSGITVRVTGSGADFYI